MKEKVRLDSILVGKGLYSSKEKARSAVMAGLVYVDGVKIEKPGQKYSTDITVVTKGDAVPYVSRGGLKLEKALTEFKISVNDKVCIDVGASTGGFTDCLLKNGAKKIYAVDVGYGQLAWSLRNDQRVVVLERTNIRYLKPDSITDIVDFAVIDVSFISLTKVIPPVLSILSDHGEVIALIKPQFEVGKENVGKKGVVKDLQQHIDCLMNLADFFLKNHLILQNITFSPITGPEGNIEFLVHLVPTNENLKDIDDNTLQIIQSVARIAHQELK